jgi:hypothetical protein
MNQLARYEAARTALAEAHRVDEVKDIRDKAEAMAAYARQAKDPELILWATEIKVRAERRAGEMLRHSADSGERHHHGRVSPTSAKPTTLVDLGITANQSSRWQQLASMSEAHFEATVATAKDTAGQVTTAFMLREAGRAKPHKKLTGADKKRLDQLNQAKSNSMLIGYARMVMKAIREAESFSEKEREVLDALRVEVDNVLTH